MKRPLRIVAIVALAASWYALRGWMNRFNTIEYHGQTVKLSRSYLEYDDYKNDPNNLAAEEVPRVQQLVKSAPIAKRLSSREEMIAPQALDLVFPGYGLSSSGTGPQQDGSALELLSIEIPQAESSRILLFRGQNGTYDLVDDFVQPDEPMIANVRVVDDHFVYSTPEGVKVVERAGSVR